MMYKKEPVNLAIATTMKDAHLTSRVFKNIVLDLDQADTNLKAQLASKAIATKTLYYAVVFDLQVLNGGIAQYFDNYGYQNNTEVIAALKILGLKEISETLADIVTEQDEITETDLEAFDNIYYAMNQEKSLNAYAKAYIIKHIEVFSY